MLLNGGSEDKKEIVITVQLVPAGSDQSVTLILIE